MRFDWEHLKNWIPGVLGGFGGYFAGGCGREFPDAEQFKAGRGAAITIRRAGNQSSSEHSPGCFSTGCAPNIFDH